MSNEFKGRKVLRNQAKLAGLNNTQVNEPVPIYHKADGEKVIKGQNNSFIVFGRDRPASLESGYGGRGETRCGTIDLVVGRMGWDPQKDKVVDNNFGSFIAADKPGDAARIYISQRTDIDDNFGLVDGAVGNSKNLSAIGLKADSIRIVARRGIKIVTGRSPQQRNSLNGKIDAQYGIDLIAGNRDEIRKNHSGAPRTELPYVQPFAKGLNLQEAIHKINKTITDLNAIVHDFIQLQLQFNSSVMTSFHQGTAGPIPVITNPDPAVIAQGTQTQVKAFSDCIMQLTMQRQTLMAIEMDYLRNSGSKWICSRYNRTN